MTLTKETIKDAQEEIEYQLNELKKDGGNDNGNTIDKTLENNENENITKILEKAKEKFKKETLNKEILKEISKEMIGNEKPIFLTFITACSTQLESTDRLSLKIRGISTAGKTITWKTTYKHIPKNWFTDLTRFTRSTLEDDIKTPGIYGGELEKLQNKNLSESIKQFSEDGMKVLKKRNNPETKKWDATYIEKEKGVLIYTTTTSSGEEEEDNRFLSITIESNKQTWSEVNKQTQFINEDLKKQIEKYKKNQNPSWILIGLEQLEKYDIINIPYSTVIKVRSNSARTQRDLKRFYSIIKALTWINQKNRPKKEIDGIKILFSTPNDFFWATWVSRNAFKQTLTGIDERLKEVYDCIETAVNDPDLSETIDDAPGYKWVNRAKIQKKLGIRTASTIKEYTESLYQMGYISIHTARGGSRVYVSTECELREENEKYHPLFEYSIDTQYKRIISYLKEKYYKKINKEFDLHLTTESTYDLPSIEKSCNCLTRHRSIVGETLGKIVGKDKDSNRYKNRKNSTTYQKNSKLYSTNSINNNSKINSEKNSARWSKPLNVKIKELKQFIMDQENKSINVTYDSLCFNFDTSFIEKCKQDKLILPNPKGGYLWGGN